MPSIQGGYGYSLVLQLAQIPIFCTYIFHTTINKNTATLQYVHVFVRAYTHLSQYLHT